MKVKTHVKLGELLLSKNINIIPKGFSKFMFNFGLIMVDQSWHVKTHPHYMEKSLSYINKKIEKLISVKKFDAFSSLQLGIVVHYLCDFCCHSHISGSIGNIPSHLKYERELQKYLLNNFDKLRNQFHSKTSSLNLNNLSTLKASIDAILSNYSKGQASYFWDIKHCFELTFLVCSSVFNLNYSKESYNMI
ncbi:zinc dependent phospholipase C family protein [Clostridium saccharoperbutylacetonicum]|uniref:zinc dependent phospholipase C family protein n=1 Tax=Clostridium saccharoperbutylacetonicum TaxID=36745 RepID=UPI000983A945|nr:zinc dependent phospholipase C family protein [Clostridium saccharoperbutylacetonicum]AQR94172.1 hypothetical protein CLSAP_14790 [Clostridium saccharoperbutylacetonicum]NSB29872.1 hypothetical protein [Clostridium saccharoperbutylacetonicum]